MRRQLRLILKMLSYVERADGIGKIPLPKCDDYSKDEIAYHVLLCSDSGYLEIRTNDLGGRPLDITRLTWAGHEALEAMRGNGAGNELEGS